MEIGLNIRRLRIQSRMTQQQLADQCDLSKGMISKIESGKVMPAVATLSKVAQSLGVKVSMLMEEGDDREAAYHTGQISVEDFRKTDKGYRFLPLAGEYGDKQMQPLLFYAQEGEVFRHEVCHQGEEFIYIIQGSMSFHVDGKLYPLTAGGSLYFDGLLPHGIESVDGEVLYLNMFSGQEYTSRVYPQHGLSLTPQD